MNADASGGMFFANTAGTALAIWTGGLPQRRIDHVLQHEAFHQFAYSRFGDDLPIWLNEGLAELFGEALLVDGTLIIGQATPPLLEEVQTAIDANKHLPFEQMLNITPAQWNAALKHESASPAYRQAWSMVHFLIYANEGQYAGAFENYLRHLNNGLPSKQAFVRSFGPDIAAFEAQWKRYVMEARPSALATALERIEFLAEGALELNRRKIHPQSLEELKSALREINFTFTQ